MPGLSVYGPLSAFTVPVIRDKPKSRHINLLTNPEQSVEVYQGNAIVHRPHQPRRPNSTANFPWASTLHSRIRVFLALVVCPVG